MKRLLLSLIAILCVGLGSMKAEEFVLGGCNHKIATGSGYGSDAAGEIAAAMYIPASKLRALTGNEISRIDVGLISRINVRNLNVWVRKSLDGENLAVEVIERPVVGWNEVKFAKPYVIEENVDGLYIGFNYENAGSSHPVSFIGNADEYKSYLKVMANGNWGDMSERGALSIEAIVTGGNLPQYDIALVSGNVYPNISAGENHYNVTGEVTNLALKEITGFNVAVKQGDATVGSFHVASKLERGAKETFIADIATAAPLSGEVEIIITSVDGGKDADDTNNRLTAKVSFPKNVVVEEFTTELCPNCPEPGRWFSTVLESNPLYHTRVVPICHHTAFGTDWLTRDCDNALLWLYDLNGQSFAPAAMFNRHGAFRKGLNQDRLEPIVALRSQKDFEDCIKAELEEETHAMVGLAIDRWGDNGDGEEIDVKVSILTDDNFNLTNPILVFYVLEDGIQSIDQKGSNSSYIHHHVIRDDNGEYGEDIEINGNTFEKIITVKMNPEWNRKNIYFAAFVANKDLTDINNNKVENGNTLYLADVPAGVTGVQNGEKTEVCRYDVTGMRHDSEFEGINIIVYSDGTTKKVFVKK